MEVWGLSQHLSECSGLSPESQLQSQPAAEAMEPSCGPHFSPTLLSTHDCVGERVHPSETTVTWSKITCQGSKLRAAAALSGYVIIRLVQQALLCLDLRLQTESNIKQCPDE